ncbi:hypothetical protein EFO98_15380 [Lactiplantibacillus argentoratensis]|nr:hypothetical protein [Lactiplantibacillus argentoratensis]
MKRVKQYKQINLFGDTTKEIKKEKIDDKKRQKDRKIQETILELQKKYGNKNVILKASDLEDGSTTKERNNQIGGHHA